MNYNNPARPILETSDPVSGQSNKNWTVFKSFFPDPCFGNDLYSVQCTYSLRFKEIHECCNDRELENLVSFIHLQIYFKHIHLDISNGLKLILMEEISLWSVPEVLQIVAIFLTLLNQVMGGGGGLFYKKRRYILQDLLFSTKKTFKLQYIR